MFNISFAEIQQKILKTSNLSVVSNRPLNLGSRNNLHLYHVVHVSCRAEKSQWLQARPFLRANYAILFKRIKKLTILCKVSTQEWLKAVELRAIDLRCTVIKSRIGEMLAGKKGHGLILISQGKGKLFHFWVNLGRLVRLCL